MVLGAHLADETCTVSQLENCDDTWAVVSWRAMSSKDWCEQIL